MITFEQVSKRYGERLALDAASWHMDEGECVVVHGPSGAGKTTLLRLITHEIQPTSAWARCPASSSATRSATSTPIPTSSSSPK
jgi:ABC-type multidrug transport system ATPase subunit